MNDIDNLTYENGAAAPIALPEIAEATIVALARQIDENGFAVLPNYIDDGLLAQLRQLVLKVNTEAKGEYAVLSGKGEMTNTVLDKIGDTPSFLRLMHRLYEEGSGKPAPAQSLYQVLRCLSGATGLREAYFSHYDSYVVTALLPIVTPLEGQTGDLIMKPNGRRIRSSYVTNIVDKLIVDNKWSQARFREGAIARRPGFVEVKIVPGNLYFFWGYRSVHANEPCDIDKIRATALFHFGDPHINSSLRKFTGRADARAAPATPPA